MSKYHMNNLDKEILDEKTIYEILTNGKIITFALCDNNQPYIVTLSYGYDRKEQSIYVHCADHGLKIDFIRNNPKVCATVIEDHGYIINDCNQKYRSLIIWGKLVFVDDLSEKKHGFQILFKHLEGNNELIKTKMESDEEAYKSVGMIRFDIEQIDAKGNV